MASITDKFLDNWDEVKASLGKFYEKLIQSNVSKEDIIASLRRQNFSELILKDLCFQSAITDLLGENILVLKRIKAFQDVSEATLQSLVDVSRNAYVGVIGPAADDLKDLMIKSVLGDLPLNQFRNEALKTGLSRAQANVLVSDTVQVFERGVTVTQGLNGDPDEDTYRWTGPRDDKTSDLDNEIFAWQSGRRNITLTQWLDQWGNIVIQGAHVNCRHTLEPDVL